MFKRYDTTEFTQFEAWLVKVEKMCVHPKYDMEFLDLVDNYDLEKAYLANLSPRQFLDKVANEIDS